MFRLTAILSVLALHAFAQQTTATLSIAVHDGQGAAVQNATAALKAPEAAPRNGSATSSGVILFSDVVAGTYSVKISAPGFAELSTNIKVDAGANQEVDATLSQLSRTESVTVEGSVPAPLEQASTPVVLDRQQVKMLPERPRSVSDVLPLSPDIIQLPDGRLRIAGSAEHRSALLVNSNDVTDPATGQFGASIPIDSVQTVNVLSSPFLAEYGGFTANVISVETRKPGSKWSFELNDPLPEFRWRSWHMRGLRSSTPRIAFGGPVIPDRLSFMASLQYGLQTTPVVTLPFPNNQIRKEGYNAFTELNYTLSGSNILTATFHVQRDRTKFAQIDFFNPEPVSPDTQSSTVSGSLIDHATVGSGLVESALSLSSFSGSLWPQGNLPMTLTPTGNFGNYYNEQARRSSRIEWREIYSITKNGAGTHNFKVGSTMAGTREHASVLDNPVNLLDASGALIENISFQPGQPIHQSDFEYALFAQDHWTPAPRLAIEAGLRAEQQTITSAFRVAPRGGFSWAPFGSGRTVIRGGVGVFYDRVPLNVYSFSSYPREVITMFGPNGAFFGGPIVYYNLTAEAAKSELPFIRAAQKPGNFSPNSLNWNLQIEHTLSSWLRLKAQYLSMGSDGLITLAPGVVQGQPAFVMNGNGGSQTRQYELTGTLRLSENRRLLTLGSTLLLYFSYIRTRAEGNLNDFFNYLAGVPSAIVRPDLYAPLPGDLPNRYLAWGRFQFPKKFALMPKIEYHSGTPYSSLDPLMNYVGAPNLSRYPGYLSVDARVSKDFKVNDKYSVRFSIAGTDLTNHFNPSSIHSNIGDPFYGTFFGGYRRRFTADFDVIF